MAYVICSQYLQIGFKPLIARKISSINPNLLSHNISCEVIIVLENTSRHRSHIMLQDKLQFIFECEQIECSESWADLDNHIIIAISSVISSGTGSEEIHSSDMMSTCYNPTISDNSWMECPLLNRLPNTMSSMLCD